MKAVKAVCFVALLAVVAFGIQFGFFAKTENETSERNRAPDVPVVNAGNKAQSNRPPILQHQANSAFRAKNWDLAIKLYGELSQLNPKIGLFVFRKAYALHATKRFDEAIEAYRIAANFNRFKPYALYNIACVYSLKKDKTNSLKSLKEAIDAGFPASRKPIGNDTDFEFVKDDPEFLRLEQILLPASR